MTVYLYHRVVNRKSDLVKLKILKKKYERAAHLESRKGLLVPCGR